MKKIIPHIFVVFAFITLVYLGTWQLQRREQKQVMLAKIEANINSAPISPADFKNIEQDEFRKMTITGKYLHDKEFLILNKSFNNKAGQHVITPIQTKGGKVIIVDRGWISTDKEYEKPQGEVNITAVIRSGQKLTPLAKSLSLIENNPEKQTWTWLDLPTIYKNIGAQTQNYYLDLIDEKNQNKHHCIPQESLKPIKSQDQEVCNYKTTSYPIALPAKIEVYNEHLIYVITWYSLSLVLLAVYYFRFWKK